MTTMEQGTLWELDLRTDSSAAPIWGQFDSAIKREVMGKLSLLMVKAVRPHPDSLPSQKESDHE
jgi:hypothetical protein